MTPELTRDIRTLMHIPDPETAEIDWLRDRLSAILAVEYRMQKDRHWTYHPTRHAGLIRLSRELNGEHYVDC